MSTARVDISATPDLPTVRKGIAMSAGPDVGHELFAYLADPDSQPAGGNDLFARLAVGPPIRRRGSLYIVTRANVLRQLAASPALSMRMPDSFDASAERGSAIRSILAKLMQLQPAADHRRLRGAIASEFTPRRIAALQSDMALIVDDLLREPLASGRCDVVADVCGPLPIYTTAAMLGLHHDDRPDLAQWTRTLNALITAEIDSFVSGRPSPGGRAAELDAVISYVDAIVGSRREAIRRGQPTDDLLTRLCTTELTGRVSSEEVLALVVMLLLTGIDTVGSALANVLTLLADRPDVWARVVDDPSLAEAAYSEGVRLAPPIPMVSRIADADVPVGRSVIPQGSTVLLMLACADLDPRVHERPTEFDLERAHRGGLAFGHGPHFCLGAGLAVAQGATVLRTLAAHSPRLSVLSRSAVRRSELAFNAPATLELEFRTAQAVS